MPCYMTGTAEGDVRLAADEAGKENRLLRNMLCGLCTRIEKDGPVHVDLIGGDPSLVLWWQKHKSEDQRRVAAESADNKRSELAESARLKLTQEEREALGIR